MELGWTEGGADTQDGLGARPVSDDTAAVEAAQ